MSSSTCFILADAVVDGDDWITVAVTLEIGKWLREYTNNTPDTMYVHKSSISSRLTVDISNETFVMLKLMFPNTFCDIRLGEQQ